MNYSKSLKTLTLSIVCFLFFAFGAFAQQMTPPQAPPVQEDFSDSEIETFVKINKEIIPVQENIQTDMMSSIEKEGIKVDRFQQLAQAQQTGTLKDASDDPQELAAFNKAGQEVMKLQESLQSQIQEIIEKNEMPAEKFEAIYMAYNSNPEVKQKVDEMLAEEDGA